MRCGVGHCGHCQLGPTLICRDGPVYAYATAAPWLAGAGAVSGAKPKLAVWKFASCDGCQLTLLDCEDELLALAGAGGDRLLPRGVERRRSRGRTTSRSSRARSRRRTTRSGSSEVRARLEGARHDRRLRDRGRHPGAAQLRRRRGVHAPSSTPRPSTSRRSPPRRRSRRTCRSTSSCAAARSTSASCSRSITAFLPAAGRASRPRASASSASGAARSASWSPTGRPASARSRTPAAARSARPTTAAATAASARWRRRTPSR